MSEERERDASACMRRHQAFDLAPVRESERYEGGSLGSCLNDIERDTSEAVEGSRGGGLTKQET
jgi:hypothetical protein